MCNSICFAPICLIMGNVMAPLHFSSDALLRYLFTCHTRSTELRLPFQVVSIFLMFLRSFHPYFFSLAISSSPVIACVRCAGQEEVSGGVAVHSGATAPLVTGDLSLACHSSIDPHINCANIDRYAYEFSRNKPQSLIRFVSSLSSLLHLLLLVSNKDFTHHRVPEDFVHAEQCQQQYYDTFYCRGTYCKSCEGNH